MRGQEKKGEVCIDQCMGLCGGVSKSHMQTLGQGAQKIELIIQGKDDHADLHLSIHRQRQMCIRDSYRTGRLIETLEYLEMVNFE